MNISQETSYSKFSHIYIEESVLDHPDTVRILSHYPDSTKIVINNYKDVFCRSHQNFTVQKYNPSLILARKVSNYLYKGADVCQDFGNEYFYYTGIIMNCIYDCEYCYLQGMYPSGNIVIFVNQEDFIDSVMDMLRIHPVYLCLSYDTDMLALESLTGFTARWIELARSNPDLKIEIRTKSAFDISLLPTPTDNIIFAYTMSPDEIVRNYEHFTPSLDSRITAARRVLNTPARLRLCFDPIVYTPDYLDKYKNMFDKVFNQLDPDKISDVSIGLFRISSEYLKNMRKQRLSPLTSYPFTTSNNVSGYDNTTGDMMLNSVKEQLIQYLPPDKIFTI